MASLSGPNFAAHDVDDAELQRFMELVSRRAEKAKPGHPVTFGGELSKALADYVAGATRAEQAHLKARGAGLVPA